MEIKEYNWQLGELVTLARSTRVLKKTWLALYEQLIGSRYICIREASEKQSGILVKVLGRMPSEYIKVVDGLPFCKDEREELFEGNGYTSYSFPTAEEVKEVLDILRSNADLLPVFEKASMHVNPRAKFWVRETTSHLLVAKKPLCYDVGSGSLSKVSDEEAPYRLTLVYFDKDQLNW